MIKCECGKIFNTKNSLYNHKSVSCQLNPNKKTFKCLHCSNEYARKSILTNHLLVCKRRLQKSNDINTLTTSSSMPLIISETKDIPFNLNENERKPLEYIYLLREREFIRLSEETYKVGKTAQSRLKRFDQYPNGSEVVFFRCVKDCNKIENVIIQELKKSFKIMKCYGSEYFNGDFYEMIYIINNVIDKEQKQISINNKQDEEKENSEDQDKKQI